MKIITKVIILSSIGFLCNQSQAQIMSIKGGFNLSKIINDTAFKEEDKVSEIIRSATPGFHLGATFDLPISKIFSVETGLFASTSGVKYNAEFENLYKFEFGLNILTGEIPLTIKTTFEIGENFNIYFAAGGYAAINLYGVINYREQNGSQIESYSQEIDFEDFKDEQFDVGFRFDAGVEVNGFIVGASYNLGKTPTVLEGENRVFKLSVGYRFGWNKNRA